MTAQHKQDTSAYSILDNKQMPHVKSQTAMYFIRNGEVFKCPISDNAPIQLWSLVYTFNQLTGK